MKRTRSVMGLLLALMMLLGCMPVIHAEPVRDASLDAALNGADVKFVSGDLFEPFPRKRSGEAKKPFDAIVSNPPSVTSSVSSRQGRNAKLSSIAAPL